MKLTTLCQRSRLLVPSQFRCSWRNIGQRTVSGVAPLSSTDPELLKILILEKERQKNTLDLIASEVMKSSENFYTVIIAHIRVYLDLS